MRLIDADALIAKWEEDAKHIEAFDHRGMVYAAINELKNAPTVDAQPRWIPVTERLPEYGIDVLTDNGYGEYEINHAIGGGWYWEPVAAWMPLPEPYKGGAE